MMLLLFGCFAVALGAAWDTSEPLSIADPTTLGFVGIDRVESAVPKRELWGDVQRPLPTNSFWTNLVLGSGNTLENNVAVLPYIVGSFKEGLGVMYPFVLESGDREILNIFDNRVNVVYLSAVEGFGHRNISYFDPMTVGIQWTHDRGHFGSRLSRGSPFITMEYVDSHPLVSSPQGLINGSIQVDGQIVQCKKNLVKGSKFKFSLKESDSSWIMYSSSPVAFQCSEPFALSSPEVFQGTIRLALVNNCTSGMNVNHCDGRTPRDDSAFTSLLDEHVDVIVEGSSLSFGTDSDGKSYVQIDWKTRRMGNPVFDSSSKALMFGLPHHQDLLKDSVEFSSTASHVSIAGHQIAIVGNAWKLLFDFPEVNWNSPHAIDGSKVEDIRKALQTEADFDLRKFLNASPF
jgi:endoglucanase Acf2